jgi:hypothetical protein
MYNLGRDERKRRGLVGRKYMVKNFSTKTMCNSLVKGIEKSLSKFTPKNKFELFKIT